MKNVSTTNNKKDRYKKFRLSFNLERNVALFVRKLGERERERLVMAVVSALVVVLGLLVFLGRK